MLLLVVTTHVLLISALWRTSTSVSVARGDAARPSILVWMLGERPQSPTKVSSARSLMTGTAAARPPRAATVDGLSSSTAQASLVGESVDSASSQSAERTSEPPGSSAHLRLRPSQEAIQGAFVHPATTDPRSNSPRATADERLAMAFDAKLCVLEERLPDGTVRRVYGRMVDAAPSIQREQGVPGKKVSVCQP